MSISFEEWWNDVNQSGLWPGDGYRKVAEIAFNAALARSRNYTANKVEAPDSVTFSNGRTVRIVNIGTFQSLEVK